MLGSHWPVLLLAGASCARLDVRLLLTDPACSAASPVVLAREHIPRTLHARQDDSLLSQIWTSLEIIASNAVTCPASCAGWLLSSAEVRPVHSVPLNMQAEDRRLQCGFEIAATFSLETTISCLCEDIGDDLREYVSPSAAILTNAHSSLLVAAQLA